MYLDRIKYILASNHCTLFPADKSEIFDLEKRCKGKFPDSYKEFLEMMGHGASSFWKGSDCFLGVNFTAMYNSALQLFKDNGENPNLLDNAFVFWMHQGYQAAFFYFDADPNPPIYFFSESNLLENAIIKEKDLYSFLVLQLEVEGFNCQR